MEQYITKEDMFYKKGDQVLCTFRNDADFYNYIGKIEYVDPLSNNYGVTFGETYISPRVRNIEPYVLQVGDKVKIKEYKVGPDERDPSHVKDLDLLVSTEAEVVKVGDRNTYLLDSKTLHWWVPRSSVEFISRKFPKKWAIRKDNTNYEKIDKWTSTKTSKNYQGSNFYLHSESSKCKDYFSISSVLEAGFTEISFDQFKKFILNKETIMKEITFQITAKDWARIIKVACKDWKNKIANHIINEKTIATYVEVKEMFDAATEDQKKVLKDIFPDFKYSKNAFIDKFDVDFINDLSMNLFGDSGILQIANGYIPSGRTDLEGKSFYLRADYKAILHTPTGKDGSTCIEIVKKD